MGNEKQRQPATPTVVPKKPSGNTVLWQASDGSMYILTENNFDAVLKAEYGEKYKREIAGLLTKETLNAFLSIIKSVPGEGVAANLAITGVKILAKGVVSTIGDAVAGKEITPGSVSYNIYSELFKLSNFAGGGPVGGEGAIPSALTGAYKYKKFITTKDPGFSKVAIIKFAQTKYSDELIIKGEIGFFSIGKRAEKAVITYVKKKLGHKPGYSETAGKNIEEYDISSIAQNWDGTDLENFDRFIAQGYNIGEASNLVNSRTKGLSYSIDQFKKNFEETEGFFTQARNSMGQKNYELWNTSGKAFQAAYTSPNGVIAAQKIAVGTWFGVSAFCGELLTLPATLGSFVEAGIQGIVGSGIKIGQVSADVVDALGGVKGQGAKEKPAGKIPSQPNTNSFAPGYMGAPFLSFRGVSSVQVTTNDRKDKKTKIGTAQVQTVQRSANKTKQTNTNLVTLPAGGAPSNSGAPIYGIKF